MTPCQEVPDGPRRAPGGAPDDGVEAHPQLARPALGLKPQPQPQPPVHPCPRRARECPEATRRRLRVIKIVGCMKRGGCGPPDLSVFGNQKQGLIRRSAPSSMGSGSTLDGPRDDMSTGSAARSAAAQVGGRTPTPDKPRRSDSHHSLRHEPTVVADGKSKVTAATAMLEVEGCATAAQVASVPVAKESRPLRARGAIRSERPGSPSGCRGDAGGTRE